MNTSLKIMAPALALPLAFGMAAPATAGPSNGWSEYHQADQYQNRYDDRHDWGWNKRGYRGAHRRVERRIEQLNHQLRQARRNGELTRYERRAVRARIRTVRRAYTALAHNGLSRRDVRTINWRIDQAQDALDRARYNRRYRNDRPYHGTQNYRGAY